MSKLIPIMNFCLGLNNYINSTKPYIDNEGKGYLSIAVNVDVDVQGRITTRSSYVPASLDNIRDLFVSSEGDVYGVINDKICKIDLNDYSYIEIYQLNSQDKVYYYEFYNRIYFGNGTDSGYISDDKYFGLNSDSVHRYRDYKDYKEAPKFKMMTIHNGRAFWTVNDEVPVIFFSEPFDYHIYAPARNYFLFEDEITMLKSVNNGIYVGTTKNLFFLTGSDVSDYEIATILNEGVIEGSDNYINSTNYKWGESGEVGIIFATNKGIYTGNSNGLVANRSKNILDIDVKGNKSASIVYKDKYIINFI